MGDKWSRAITRVNTSQHPANSKGMDDSREEAADGQYLVSKSHRRIELVRRLPARGSELIDGYRLLMSHDMQCVFKHLTIGHGSEAIA